MSHDVFRLASQSILLRQCAEGDSKSKGFLSFGDVVLPSAGRCRGCRNCGEGEVNMAKETPKRRMRNVTRIGREARRDPKLAAVAQSMFDQAEAVLLTVSNLDTAVRDSVSEGLAFWFTRPSIREQLQSASRNSTWDRTSSRTRISGSVIGVSWNGSVPGPRRCSDFAALLLSDEVSQGIRQRSEGDNHQPGEGGVMQIGLSALGLNCPGDIECGVSPDAVAQQSAIAAALAAAASGACTCKPDGTCAETGNSCTPAAPLVPVVMTAPVSTQVVTGVSNSTLLLIGAGVVGLIVIGRRH